MPDVNVATAQEPLLSQPDRASSISSLSWILPLIIMAWYQVVHHLQGEWSYNPQYSYGWSVPFLVGFLLWRRWSTRPDAEQPVSRWWPILGSVLAVVGLAPFRFLSDANPDWRLLSWSGSLCAVLLSLCLIYLAGGKSWLRHFAFPFLFFLVAVPWPMQLEQRIVQQLMQAVTALNVFGLHLAGVPALQHGNVIEVGSGLIGIEEACSGVRSLQATLMISLFLGELYSFPTGARVLLVVAGGILAFVCNLLRTAFLVYIGTAKGDSALHAWHDPAGLTILLCCLFGLWGLSLIMRRRISPAEMEFPAATHAPFAFPFSPSVLLALLVFLASTEVGVRFWYDWHQRQALDAHWTVNWPNENPGYEKVPISAEAQGLLQYNEGGGATWAGPDGHNWVLYHFRWLPGRTAALFVKIHRPDVCLPASGMTLIRDDGIHYFAAGGANLPIRSYRFENGATPLHVLYCYWDARSSYENAHSAAAEDWSPTGRVRAALRGQRERGAQMLELAVWGYEDDQEAHEALERQLRQVIKGA